MSADSFRPITIRQTTYPLGQQSSSKVSKESSVENTSTHQERQDSLQTYTESANELQSLWKKLLEGKISSSPPFKRLSEATGKEELDHTRYLEKVRQDIFKEGVRFDESSNTLVLPKSFIQAWEKAAKLSKDEDARFFITYSADGNYSIPSFKTQLLSDLSVLLTELLATSKLTLFDLYRAKPDFQKEDANIDLKTNCELIGVNIENINQPKLPINIQETVSGLFKWFYDNKSLKNVMFLQKQKLNESRFLTWCGGVNSIVGKEVLSATAAHCTKTDSETNLAYGNIFTGNVKPVETDPKKTITFDIPGSDISLFIPNTPAGISVAKKFLIELNENSKLVSNNSQMYIAGYTSPYPSSFLNIEVLNVDKAQKEFELELPGQKKENFIPTEPYPLSAINQGHSGSLVGIWAEGVFKPVGFVSQGLEDPNTLEMIKVYIATVSDKTLQESLILLDSKNPSND